MTTPNPDPLRAAVWSVKDPVSRLIDRLRSALRIRTPHATVCGALGSARAGQQGMCAFPLHGNLDPATVLCAGRGRLPIGGGSRSRSVEAGSG